MRDFLEQEKKVLELESRKKIYDVVKKFAGCHFREIQRKCGLATGSVQYHVHFLVRSGLIKEVRRGKALLYVPQEFVSDGTLLGFLRQGSLRKIILFLLMNQKASHESVVRAVQLSPSTVSWHLKKLQDAGVVQAVVEGRRTFFFLSADKDVLMKLLITYKESFVDKLVDRVVEMWVAE